jgi:Bacterial protein of unknown function (DUF882)
MLVKPLTSLALCALAVTVTLPAYAVSLEASGPTTLVVTAPTVAPAPPHATIVRVTHRSRKATKKKVVVKVVSHHAEPSKTPVVAAVVTTPLTVTKVKAGAKKTGHASVRHSSAHVKGEIMIGPAHAGAEPKVPSKTIPPAEIEVKTQATREVSPSGKMEVKRVKATVGAVKVTVGPVAQQSAVPEKTLSGSVKLQAGNGEAKIVASESVATPIKGQAGAKLAAKPPCMHEGVEFVRGQEAETFSLTRCDGSVAPLALEKLSILARPESAPLPKSVDDLAKVKGPNLAAGIRRMDPGLALRIQTITEHFAKNGPVKVAVVSGYRPMSSGSYHATAQAMDLRVEGVANEAVVEFCKTLVDTGCGYYPNSSFVHVDVRQPGTGHVSWIDASGPGEAPHYVASWPLPPDSEVKSAEKLENPIDKLDPELPQLPTDDHPAAPGLSATIPAPLDVAK